MRIDIQLIFRIFDCRVLNSTLSENTGRRWESERKMSDKNITFRTETCDREAVCPVNIRRLRVRYDSCDSRRLRRKTKLVFADSRLRAIIIANESDIVVKSHEVENE